MKIVIISDIHANYAALKSIGSYLESADKILCLGDIVGYYCQVNEVIDYLRELNATCIMGNHDYFLINGYSFDAAPEIKFGIDFAESVITTGNLDWLKSLPLIWSGFLDNVSFLLAHGSPWDPLRDYLYSNNPRLHDLDSFKYDVIAFGQTHRSLMRTNQKPYCINPGSVGQSRDRYLTACALQVETSDLIFKPIECKYDAAPVIALLKENNAHTNAFKHLFEPAKEKQ